jgi:hypothetical protein
MATQAMCNSFKLELFSCYHCFTAPTLTSGTRAADVFNIALYTSASTNDSTTAAYTTTNEITNTAGTAYVAGGQTLVGAVAANTTSTSWVDFTTDPQWTTATFTANSALIYNATQLVSGNGRSVCVLSFGGDKTITAGTFTVQFPTADASSALIRISA